MRCTKSRTTSGRQANRKATTGGAVAGVFRGVWKNEHGDVTPPPFDIDVFLSQPLTARIATDGPSVRPVWFLWEENAFWVLTGPWTKLFHRVSDSVRDVTVTVERHGRLRPREDELHGTPADHHRPGGGGPAIPDREGIPSRTRRHIHGAGPVREAHCSSRGPSMRRIPRRSANSRAAGE